MSSTIIPNEHLRYMEQSEIPVFRYNKENRRCSLDPSMLSKHNQNMVPPRLTINNQSLDHQSFDSLNRIQNYSDGIPMTPPTNPFVKNKKLETEITSSPNRSAVAGVWMVNEMLPPIAEEDDKKKSTTQSSRSSNAQSWSNVPSTQGSPKNIIESVPETSDSNNGSFEKMKTLLKNASFASTISSTAPANELPENQERYQNLGFAGDWEENKSAPEDFGIRRTSEDFNNEINEAQRRPRFRISESSSNNEQFSK